jgi:tetratricopeptide (TPR) repeat protein
MHAHAIAALALLVAAAGISPAAAQTRDGDYITRAREPAQRNAAARGQQDEEVDESALRYYASLRQTERVEAETRRLQRLYPGWKPPGDIYRTVEPGGADEEELWTLFSLDRMEELHAAIERRKEIQPGWKPSRDLSSKLVRKELRLKILSLIRQGESEALFEFMRAVSHQSEDIDLDVQWLLAETYARAKQTQDAGAIFQSILSTTNKQQERIATIQKAMGVLPMSQVEQLLASVPDARSEFAAIWVDITRARISAFLQEDRNEEVPAADVAALQPGAMASPDPNQAGLLAWYAFKRNRPSEALEMFKVALEKGGDAMIAHGLAHSLLKQGMRREAEEVSYAWREPLVHNAILFIDTLAEELTREVPVFIETERLARYGRVVMQSESGEGAQALAWYAYNSCQYDSALPWFERAMAWYPKSATAMGYALTLQRLKRRKDVIELVNRYDGLFAELVTLVLPDGSQRPPQACDPTAQATRTTREPAPAPREAWGRVAPPTTAMASQREQDAVLRNLNRKEFPIPVFPDNNLRFTALGSFAPAAEGGWLREPYTGPFPQVARRVPGVGPMPYERYGFTLLPGWNGTESPTWPPASAQLPPEGTLWAAQIVAQSGPQTQPKPPEHAHEDDRPYRRGIFGCAQPCGLRHLAAAQR